MPNISSVTTPTGYMGFGENASVAVSTSVTIYGSNFSKNLTIQLGQSQDSNGNEVSMSGSQIAAVVSSTGTTISTMTVNVIMLVLPVQPAG